MNAISTSSNAGPIVMETDGQAFDPIQAVKDVAGEGATRADRRRALRELKRQMKYQQTGFFPTGFNYVPNKGHRSKYDPHIGAKEQGRYTR